MGDIIHITNGDCAGEVIEKTGIGGQVFVCNDLLYDGPRRKPGWPDDATLEGRARFLQGMTGGGLESGPILEALNGQYRRLATVAEADGIVLWFDACLCDQAMLAHLLACLNHQGVDRVELLCIDAFPGLEPFNGLGQLKPDQLASLYDQRRPVSEEQFAFAEIVDRAFARQDSVLLADLAGKTEAPLPWVTAAAARWLQEQPDPVTGLGRLESFALKAVQSGCEKPGEIFAYVAAADTPPQYWGDTILWAKINGLARRKPPLLHIEGPADRLPQWDSPFALKDFRIKTSPR